MNVQQIDHLNLTVQSFEQSADWYLRVFGFEIVEQAVDDGIRWGVLRAGEALLCIYERPKREQLDRFRLEERGLHGLSHFALRVSDEQDWLATIERENLDLLYDGVIEWPYSKSWYVNDPTGYEVEISLWQADTIRFRPLA